MATAPNLEQQGSSAEQLVSPEGGKGLEALLENPQAVQRFVDRVAEDAVVDAIDFTKSAQDSDFPDVGAAVKAQADALEQQIRQAATKAKSEIGRIERGEAEPTDAIGEARPASPEIQLAETFQQIGDQARELRQAPEEKLQPTPTEVIKDPAPVADFAARLKEITAEFKASGNQPSKLLQRKLAKLMMDAHPDKFKADPRLEELSRMMGRLTMAINGDVSAWQPLDGVPFDEELSAWQMKDGGTSEGAAPPAPEAPAAEAAPAAQTEEKRVAPPDAAGSAKEGVAETLDQDIESAIASGDATVAQAAFDNVEKMYAAEMASRQEELDALYKTPPQKRTPLMQAKIDSLEYANAIDRKALERRRKQLELISLRKELAQIEAEISHVQAELKPYEGQQTNNLLSQTAEGGRVLVGAGPDHKQGLETKLAELQAKHVQLSEKIALTQATIVELAETIASLDALRGKAEREAKSLEAKPSIPSADKPGGFGFLLPRGDAKAAAPKKSGSSGEDLINATIEAIHDPVQAASKAVQKVFGAPTKKN